MADWKCEKCSWVNPEKWEKCMNCGYPQMGTDEEKQTWNKAKEPAQPEEVDLAYLSKTIGNFGQAQIDLLKSTDSKLGFIVWVLIIAIILQVLFGLRIL